jgi:nucleotide sugar dehydrogenase
MGSAEGAEFAKLAETTYRDVNIGLANEFALFAERSGIDFDQVVQACNSQPYSHIHKPGIAVGGHCIPVYPRLYLWNDPRATIVKAARQANEIMPYAVVDRIESEHGSLRGMSVAVLGAAYRGGVKETAFSGVFPLVERLKERGALVAVHDPLYEDEELSLLGLQPYHLGEPTDIVIVQADHAEYADWTSRLAPGVRLVFDGRGIIKPTRIEDGVTFMRIGVSRSTTGGSMERDSGVEYS